jgi:LPS O-antigen subunit length determinant protein (WzzB/FepE family)|tara:strand:+ start:38 stop:946 length:909 start_codon:yes stop_codon:yes gene_type:complete
MNNTDPKKSSFTEDEIDIKKLLQILWHGKIFIVALTSVFFITAVIYSLILPNVYQSNGLLSPVDESSSSQAFGDIGGLASLAGIDISSGSGGNVAKSLQKARTFSFFRDNILPNIFLPDLVAMNSWDEENNTIIYNEEIFNQKTQTWSRLLSNQKSHELFLNITNLKQDNTGFITVSVKHRSPYIAQAWTELIVEQLNDFYRTKDKLEAQLAIDFLNTQMLQTRHTEIKQVIAQLIQKRMQQLTLIEANKFYVFSYLDSPIVMEGKIEPNRKSISILGAVLGGLLGILIILIQHYLGYRKLN